jgi:hypothetical protein
VVGRILVVELVVELVVVLETIQVEEEVLKVQMGELKEMVNWVQELTLLLEAQVDLREYQAQLGLGEVYSVLWVLEDLNLVLRALEVD